MNADMQGLRKPFEARDIEWRVAQSGTGKNGPWAKVLAYVNARAIMNRLDEQVGPENWQDVYRKEQGGVMCGIGIRVPAGLLTQTNRETRHDHGSEWVWKWDGSQETDIEAFKGGISKALVRCAVKWGMGRYLYDFPETWANIVPKGTSGAKYAKLKDGTPFYWTAPIYDQVMEYLESKGELTRGASTQKAGKRRGKELDDMYKDGVMTDEECDELLSHYGVTEFHDLPKDEVEKWITTLKLRSGE